MASNTSRFHAICGSVKEDLGRGNAEIYLRWKSHTADSCFIRRSKASGMIQPCNSVVGTLLKMLPDDFKQEFSQGFLVRTSPKDFS